MAALTAENEGDLASARSTWMELAAEYANETDEAKAMWGWHAQKKLNDLMATTRTLATEVMAKVEEFRVDDKDVRPRRDLDRQVATPLRLEQFGDFALAHTRWAQTRESRSRATGDRRPLAVNARGRVRDLEAKQGLAEGPVRTGERR